jgi:hypothetical protein
VLEFVIAFKNPFWVQALITLPRDKSLFVFIHHLKPAGGFLQSGFTR